MMIGKLENESPALKHSGLLFICCLIVMSFAPWSGFSKERFRIDELKLKGEIADIITEDINRDGLGDLAVIHVSWEGKKPRRLVSVLWQDKEAGFDLQRGYSFQPEREVVIIDVGQVDGKDGLDIICLCESGVKYYPQLGNGFGNLTFLLDRQSAAGLASPGALRFEDFVKDWNGDGKDDLLLFQLGGALFYKGGGDGLDLDRPQSLAIKPWSEIQVMGGAQGDSADREDLLGITCYLPRVYSRDWDGDGTKDLIAVGRKDIHVFFQAKDGTYPPGLAGDFEVEVFSPREERDSPKPHYPPNLSFADLDRDGKTDVVAQQAVGYLGRMKSKVLLYWGRTGSVSGGRPDISFTTEDIAIQALVSDVNRDGLLDMVIPTLGLGLFSVGRVFVTGTFPIDLHFYLQTEDHSFNTRPDYTQTTNLVFDLNKFRLAAGIPGIFGDFDGDGYPDEVVGKSKNQLEITIKDSSGKHTDKRETISVPVSMMPVVEDLNADKMSDIILNYIDDPDRQGEIRVLINTGPW